MNEDRFAKDRVNALALPVLDDLESQLNEINAGFVNVAIGLEELADRTFGPVLSHVAHEGEPKVELAALHRGRDCV